MVAGWGSLAQPCIINWVWDQSNATHPPLLPPTTHWGALCPAGTKGQGAYPKHTPDTSRCRSRSTHTGRGSGLGVSNRGWGPGQLGCTAQCPMGHLGQGLSFGGLSLGHPGSDGGLCPGEHPAGSPPSTSPELCPETIFSRKAGLTLPPLSQVRNPKPPAPVGSGLSHVMVVPALGRKCSFWEQPVCPICAGALGPCIGPAPLGVGGGGPAVPMPRAPGRSMKTWQGCSSQGSRKVPSLGSSP